MHTASKISVRTITMTALLSAIAYILAFVEFPVPLSPPFARMDFSDFPADIGVAWNLPIWAGYSFCRLPVHIFS